jgi:hypothetical protein
MSAYYITSLIYPDAGPVWFLLCMLGVISLAIWVGIKE